ncbi:SRPBCC family protein [Silvimonas soli]|uniref:SRPBCC family protein n=1 Tax=Silvimonas soli TaxID=2980100 RepID=UPI0024B3268F|nr:SRPBCC family protein [Silvimonas soli]
MRQNILFASLASLLLVWTSMASAADAAASAVEAHVEKAGQTVKLDSEFTVPVSREIAWQVLTDFEHMASFVPNLTSSQVLERTPKSLKVEQKGSVPFGPFHVAYDSIREVELTPMTEIHAKAVGGDSGAMTSVSTLSEKNGQTVVSYRAEWTPTSKLVGSFGTGAARDQLLHQFSAMEQEMLRRGGHKGKAADASAADAAAQ